MVPEWHHLQQLPSVATVVVGTISGQAVAISSTVSACSCMFEPCLWLRCLACLPTSSLNLAIKCQLRRIQSMYGTCSQHCHLIAARLCVEFSRGCKPVSLQIREENHELAQQAHVHAMTVDHVYDYLTQEPASARDVSFILVPSAREVKSAMKLFEAADMAMSAFKGVPVFQAEDLSLDIDSKVQTPNPALQ
jgi:hypothetical protein